MPEWDGLTTTRAIRAREHDRGLPRLPVLALTANAMAGFERTCLEAGMDGVLIKPLKEEELAAALDQWLPGRVKVFKPSRGPAVVPTPGPVTRLFKADKIRKLCHDGPARIEEIHELCTKEVDKEIIEAGKQIQFDADVHNIHPKAQRLLGRLKFRSSYGQNNYKHSVEVAHIMGMLASELGMDPKLARRCGLMHDIGKAIDHEKEGGHPLVGKEFLISIGERPEVIESAGGHHDQPMHHKYPYVSLAAAADAISASRPGARRESMERYVQRLTALEAVAKSFDGVSEAFAMQAGRELRVLVNSKKVTDDEALLICRQMAEKIEDELTYPGEIRVTLMRETRVTEYAR